MSLDLLVAFAVFAFASSITPGPNNMMLLASGVHHGFVRTLPHIAGISLGCMLMTVLIGFGAGGVLAASPWLYAALRYAGAMYLLVLAWRIARSGLLPTGGIGKPPLGFWRAAAFQWVNPKAWIMVTGAVTTFAPHDHFMWNVCVIAVAMVLVNLPSISVWAAFGTGMRRLLGSPGRIRAFNIGMALLLVGSLYPVLK